MKQVGSLRTKHRFKKTEIGEIPVDWEVCRLGDHAYIKARIGWRGLSASEYTKEGPLLIAGNHIVGTKILWEKCDHISRFRYDESPEIKLKNGDVIISKDGTIGRLGFIDKLHQEATIGGTMMLMRPDDKFFHSRYVYYYFQGEYFQNIIRGKVSGSSVPHIFQRDIVSLRIPLIPIKEQRKIADFFSTVDEAIEKSKEVIEKTKELKRGLMQELLTRGIGHKKFRETEIGEIPMDWEIVKLKDVAAKQRYAFVDGSFGSNLKTVHYTKQGVPVIQSQFIISGKFKPVETFFVSEQKAKELERSKVVPGDIVIAKIGVNYGASSTVPVNYPESVLSGNTMKITPNLNKVVTEFLQYVFHYFRMIKVFDKIDSTTAQPAITLKGAKNLKMPLPKISEQKKIAEILFSADEEIEKEIAHKERLEKIKKGLMQVLLTGKIRVKV